MPTAVGITANAAHMVQAAMRWPASENRPVAARYSGDSWGNSRRIRVIGRIQISPNRVPSC